MQILRQFSFTAKVAAKKREHVRPFVRAHVRPPPAPKPPKPTPTSTPIAPPPEAPEWYKYITTKQSKPSDGIREFLKRILKYSSFESIETLCDNKWTLLQREVKRYDGIVGPGHEGGIEVPKSVYEMIEAGRRDSDPTILVRVYDAFLHLLERAAGEGETNFEDHVVNNELDKIMDEFTKLSRCGEDIFINTMLQKKGLKIEQLWGTLNGNVIPPPQLVHLLVRFPEMFTSKFQNDIARIIANSERGATTAEEVELVVCAVINGKSTDEIGKIIGLFPLSSKAYERIVIERGPSNSIKAFADEGYTLTNASMRSIMRRYASEGNINGIIKLLEYSGIENERVFFEEDWDCVIRSLVKVGYREAAIDILKSLVIIREGWIEEFSKEFKFSADLSYTLQDAENLTSIVCTSGKLIETVPSWKDGHISLLLTSENREEFEEIVSLVGKPVTAEDVKVRLLVADKFGIKFEEMQQILAEGLNELPLAEIDALVLDRETLGVVVRIVEKCGQVDSVEEEWGQLLIRSESSDETWQSMIEEAVSEATADAAAADAAAASSGDPLDDLDGCRGRFRANADVSAGLRALLAVARLSV